MNKTNKKRTIIKKDKISENIDKIRIKEKFTCNPGPTIYEVKGGMLNSIGLENIG